jgi:integrase
MPKKKSIFPGSVYADRGKLYIKIRVEGERDKNGVARFRKIATGLDDTVQGRKLAEEKKKNLFIHKFLPPDQQNPPRQLYIKEAWELFVTAKNMRSNTLRNYRLSFDTITRKQNYPLTIEAVEKDVLYFKNITAVEGKYAAATENSYLNEFQIFLNWCTRKKWLEQTHFKSEFRRKDTKTEVKIYTAEEVAKIMPVLYADNKEFALLIALMLHTGARPVDALTLEFESWRGKTIVWKNKITKESEETPISTEAERIMSELKELAGGREKCFRWQHSSLSSLTRKFNRLLDVAGVEKKGRNFKHFRTTFKFHIRSLPFELQMKLMRHRSPDVTLNNYTYFDQTEIVTKLDNLVAPLVG